MAMPTAIVASANRNKSLPPATSLPIEEPIAAPAISAAANVAAHGHFTLPARQWPIKLPKALSETASALVPMTRCASPMPTTSSKSGIASIEPPPPKLANAKPMAVIEGAGAHALPCGEITTGAP